MLGKVEDITLKTFQIDNYIYERYLLGKRMACFK